MPEPHDDQDLAEGVDNEVLSDVDDDPAGSLAFPPDRPMGVEDYGTRAAEERVDEPLEERVRREVPDLGDPFEADDGDAELIRAALEQDDDPTDDPDDELDRYTPIGRLVDPGADDDGFDVEDDEPDAVASRVEAGDLSAEEAAIHLTAAPPFRPDE